MTNPKSRYKNRLKRKRRIRKRISGTTEVPRLTVFRSDRHIYAQLVDDSTGRTVTGVSSLSPKLKDVISKVRKDGKLAMSRAVGEAIAQEAGKLKIESVVFDRGGFRYHGRIKALADGAREAGLKF